VRNWKAFLAVVLALLALGVLAAAAYLARTDVRVSWLQAALALPAAGVLALASLALARRAYALHQRTLGRVGGRRLAATGRLLGALALLVTLTGGLAVGVFGVLVWTDGFSRTPW
jgi:hypothetical protein